MKIIKKSQERTAEDNRKLREIVSGIIDKVCEEGDAALREYNEKFDGCKRQDLRVTREEIEAAYAKMTPQELSDLKEALGNLKGFAEAQRATMTELKDYSPKPGIFLGHKVMPVQSALCYVPGGGYPLYSTALMLITPAKVAGVKRVAACAPAVKGTNLIDYKTLVAMDLAGADEIYVVGGAQSIAAFAYGTESIKPVDVICGPGNQFVAEAKRQCFGQVGIDMVAGPSEVLVLADGSGNPEFVAADLLAQSEHAPNAKGLLLSLDEEFANKVIACVEKELETLPTADIARESWETYGGVAVVSSLDELAEIANEYAPEHLELNLADPEQIIPKLYNYGSLFIGENVAEVFGDYAAGVNHSLPTMRAARYTGGVYVGTFLKTCTHSRMTREASRAIAPLVNRMAKGEGLMGHALAAEKRF